MIPQNFSNQVSALLMTAGYEEPFEFSLLTGGKNNRVFIVHQNAQSIGVLKQYYHQKADLRDRLDSEWRFLTFLWNNNIHQIPEPIVSDPVSHIAFYSFIDGKKLHPKKITWDHIDQAIDFFNSLNSFRMSDSGRSLPNASEACFSLGDHIRLVDRRIQKLETIKGRSRMDKKARVFIDNELLPVWKNVRTASCQLIDDLHLIPDEEMSFNNRRLSPSDFGFHNALEDNCGKLFFLDFEYAGWDDPAKTICDFFCQPAIPVPKRFLPVLIDKITKDMDEPEIQCKRIDLLLPVYQIKWCCVVLNEFLPWGRSRRIFMDSDSDPDVIKEEQLRKASVIIQDVVENL